MRMAAGLACAIALISCGPKASAPAGTDAPAAPAAPAGIEGPARYYDAISKTAEAFTGALEVHDVSPAAPNAAPSIKVLTENGHIYEADLIGDERGGDRLGVTNWAALLPIPADADVAMESVTSELVNAKAPNGGLCSPDATKFMALATYREDDGATMMQIAAFSDETWPPQKTPKLCGAFTYQLRASPAQTRGADH